MYSVLSHQRPHETSGVTRCSRLMGIKTTPGNPLWPTISYRTQRWWPRGRGRTCPDPVLLGVKNPWRTYGPHLRSWNVHTRVALRTCRDLFPTRDQGNLSASLTRSLSNSSNGSQCKRSLSGIWVWVKTDWSFGCGIEQTRHHGNHLHLGLHNLLTRSKRSLFPFTWRTISCGKRSITMNNER